MEVMGVHREQLEPGVHTVLQSAIDQTGGVIQDGVGTVGLTKVGAGTQTLTGANTYTGGTALLGGILTLGRPGAIGTIRVHFEY